MEKKSRQKLEKKKNMLLYYWHSHTARHWSIVFVFAFYYLKSVFVERFSNRWTNMWSCGGHWRRKRSRAHAAEETKRPIEVTTDFIRDHTHHSHRFVCRYFGLHENPLIAANKPKSHKNRKQWTALCVATSASKANINIYYFTKVSHWACLEICWVIAEKHNIQC